MAKAREGTIIAGRYELVSMLGQGTYATVWKAGQVDVDTEVAVKILNPGYSEDPQLVEEFVSDARSYAAFRDNPRIVTILDCGQDLDTGFTYIAMDLHPDSLDGIIRKAGPLPAERVLRLAEDLGAALRTVHRAGLVHRDIKSTNLLTVAGDDRFVLSDFAVGMFEDQDERNAPTMDLSRTGNWAYAAPERVHATKKSEVGPSADIYSAGVVLFRAATGRYPFTSRFPQIISDHLETEPQDPRSLRPDLPRALSELILRCLRKRPSDRFASADELLAAAQEARTARESRRPPKLPSRPLLIAGAGLAALALLVFLAVTFIPRGRDAEIRTQPPGARFRLYAGAVTSRFDAIENGTTPATVGGLEERRYTVVVEKEGFFSKEVSFTPSKDSPLPETIVLENSVDLQVTSQPAGAFATLRPLDSDEIANGGPTPSEFHSLRAGPHELTLRLANFATLIDTILVGHDGGAIERTLIGGEPVAIEVVSRLRPASEAADASPEASSDVTTEPPSRDARQDRLDQLANSIPEKIRRGEWDAADRELTEFLRSRPEEPSAESWKRRIEDGRKELRAQRAEAAEREEPQVERTLQMYRESLEQRDLKQFARLWVSLPARELQEFEASFERIESQSVEIEESSLEIEGNQATVRFHEKRRVRPEGGRDVVSARDRVMKLRRIGTGEWLIASLE